MLFSRYSILIVACLMAIIGAQAQHAFTMQHIPYKDAKPLGYARDIIQDTTGLLWISSEVGLFAYDVKDFSLYHNKSEDKYLPGRAGAIHLLEDEQHNIIYSKKYWK